MGGGDTSTLWNGLTVGGGYAVGNATMSSGILINASSINTAGGNIAMYGKGRAGAAVNDSYSENTDGIRLENANTIDSGTGTIYMKGIAQTAVGGNTSANGIELSINGVSVIKSANTTADAIYMYGEAASDIATNSWGIYTWNNIIEATGEGGGITLEGIGYKDSGVTIPTNGAVLAKSGTITLNGLGYGSRTPYSVNIQGNVGSKAGTDVTSSSSNVIVNGNTFYANGYINTSGTVTIQPYGDDFASAFTLPNILSSTITGLTIGKSTTSSDGTNDVDVTIANTIDIAGAINIFGGNINLNADIDTQDGDADGDILFKSSGSIIQAANVDIDTAGSDVTYWANSDDETINGGYIYLQDTTTIDTRTSSDRTANDGTADDTLGGAITMGGGSGTTVPTGYALYTGTDMVRGGISFGTVSNTDNPHNSAVSIVSGGGDIALKGKSTGTYNGDSAGISSYEGFTFDAGSTGDITLVGDVSSVGNYSDGIILGNYATTAGRTASYIKTVNGDISLTGTASNANTQSRGITLAGGDAGLFIQSTGTGNIDITGTPSGTGTQYNILLIGTNILANSGDIDLVGGSTGKILNANYASTIGYKSGSDVTSSTSDITITGDDFDLSSGFNFNTAGTLTVESFGNSFTNAFNTSQLIYSSDLTGLTIGKSTNTANVTIGSDTTIAGPINIYGGDITINNKLEATSSTITLDGSGNVIDGVNGYVVASNLLLSDGAVTLDNANNDIDNIAASGVDSLTFYDTDAIAIGSTIGGVTGISSTGNVILNAGADESGGTSIGGDITVSGTPTISSSSGNVKLYSGSISGSTTTAGLISAGNFRYNSDEGSDGFTTALGVTGNYLLYREQPTLTITATADSKTYDGQAYTGGNGVSYGGFVNADTSTISVGGTLSYGGTSQSAINAGTYTLIPSGFSSKLGYALSYSNGALTVNKALLTVTAIADSKTYDGLAYSGGNGVNYTGFVNSETSSVLGGTLAYGGTSQGAINAGSYVITPSGLTSGNYTLAYVNGVLTIIAATAPEPTNTIDPILYTPVPLVVQNPVLSSPQQIGINTPPRVFIPQAGPVRLNVSSTPVPGQPMRLVSLDEIRLALEAQNNQSDNFVIPAGNGSMLGIINDGTLLPNGVYQLFLADI